MGRAPCCDKQGLKKGPWTTEEDEVLVEYVKKNGHGSWRSLPKLAGLLRCGKSCRLRWTNYLRPDIKRGPFTADEEKTIIQLHGILGNRWSSIASQLPGRTDNEIKNFFNTHLKKKLLRMGLDPQTHVPPIGLTFNSLGPTQENSAMRHMAQWENARLEAEERLSRESLLFSFHSEPTGKTIPPESDYFLKIWNSDVGENFRRLSNGQPDSTVKSFDSPGSPSPASSSTKYRSEEMVTTATVATARNRQEELECKSCVSDPGEFLSGRNEEPVKVEDSSSSNELDESATSFSDLLGSELLLDFPTRISDSGSFSQQMWPWADLRTDFKDL